MLYRKIDIIQLKAVTYFKESSNRNTIVVFSNVGKNSNEISFQKLLRNYNFFKTMNSKF